MSNDISFSKNIENINELKKIMEIMKDCFTRCIVFVNDNGLFISQIEKSKGISRDFIIHCFLGNCVISNVKDNFSISKSFKKIFKTELLYKSIKFSNGSELSISNSGDNIVLKDDKRKHTILNIDSDVDDISFFLKNRIRTISVNNSSICYIIKSIKSLEFELVLLIYDFKENVIRVKSKQSIQEISFNIGFDVKDDIDNDKVIMQELKISDLYRILKCCSIRKDITLSIFKEGIEFNYPIDSGYISIMCSCSDTKFLKRN